MKTKRVKCKSGITGWQGKLRDQYNDKEEFLVWSEMYGIHKRLGYKSAETAWRANPTVQGSVIPSDYRKVKA